MEGSKKISSAVIKRLPRYFRYLRSLHEEGVARISSRELSERMNITASQIRQDLNCFGGFGQQGYGYNVEALYKEIAAILGIDNEINYIIIGAGNLGQALAKYKSFSKRGFRACGVFDIDDNLVGRQIENLTIQHMNTLPEFVANNKVDIAMLCVPRSATNEVAEEVVQLGIEGIWNFSPTDLRIAQKAVVENVHLSDSLMVLGYKLNEFRKNSGRL